MVEDLFGPFHLKRIVRHAHDAVDLHGHGALADGFEGIVRLSVLIERNGAVIGGVVVSLQPVAADNHRIRAEAAYIGNEAAQIPGHFGVGGDIILGGGRDGLDCAKFIDLHHIRRHPALDGLPCQGAAEAKGQAQTPKGHHAPVLGLDAGGADAVVPDLGRALIGRGGCWGQAIALDRTTEHQASFWSRSGLAAAAGRSPSLIAWVVAWLWARRRPSLCMRLAQAGWAALAAAPALAGAGPFSLAAPPFRRPPVARKAAAPPALARAVASCQPPSPQVLAALPAAAMPAAATPPRPAATPAAPLSPEVARAIW